MGKKWLQHKIGQNSEYDSNKWEFIAGLAEGRTEWSDIMWGMQVVTDNEGYQILRGVDSG